MYILTKIKIFQYQKTKLRMMTNRQVYDLLLDYAVFYRGHSWAL